MSVAEPLLLVGVRPLCGLALEPAVSLVIPASLIEISPASRSPVACSDGETRSFVVRSSCSIGSTPVYPTSFLLGQDTSGSVIAPLGAAQPTPWLKHSLRPTCPIGSLVFACPGPRFELPDVLSVQSTHFVQHVLRTAPRFETSLSFVVLRTSRSSTWPIEDDKSNDEEAKASASYTDGMKDSDGPVKENGKGQRRDSERNRKGTAMRQ